MGITASVERITAAVNMQSDLVAQIAAEIQVKLEGDEDSCIYQKICEGTITEIEAGWESVRKGLFYSNDILTKAHFPKATHIGKEAFKNCEALEDIYFPKVTSIDEQAFNKANKLKSVVMPSVTSLAYGVFYACESLVKVDFPVLTFMGQFALTNCSALTAVILRSETLCVSEYPINNTPIKNGTGYIYVPKALLSSYKTATNWSTHANQFRALEDYTVDGTITGELDESKI